MKIRILIVVVLLCNFMSMTVYAADSYQYCTDSIHLKTEVFNPATAAQDYLDQLTTDQKERSDAYFEGSYWISLWNILIEVLVAWIFLSLGLSKWIKRIATKAKKVNIQNLIYISLYLLFVFLLTFPMNVYTGFIREHQYNLSNLTFGGWLGEELKSLLVSLILGAPVFMLLYIAIQKTGNRWWVWGGGIGVLFLVISVFIGPIFISPLFNKYKPLEDGHLKKEILSIARANGVPADNVYQFDASKQSTRISANVSGIGSTIRISLNDNLLNRCSTEEIKAVMAHEIGHYVLNHIYKLILMSGLLMIVGFAVINWAYHRIIRQFGQIWDVHSISDIGGFPLIVLLFAAFFFISSPVQNNISRTTEIEADYFGLNAAREPDGFASVTMKLSEYRKISPGHWEEILFYDHPSGKTRVTNAMIWKGEHLRIDP